MAATVTAGWGKTRFQARERWLAATARLRVWYRRAIGSRSTEVSAWSFWAWARSSRMTRSNLSSLADAAFKARSRRAAWSRWTRSVVRVWSTLRPASITAWPVAQSR